jgi:hypothetical protein
MSVRARFTELAHQWAQHCEAVSYSSSPTVYLNHPAVQQLIDLGPDVVPLIMDRFATDFSCPWEHVLAAVTGVSMIDDPERIDAAEVHRRRLEWWEANRHRYDDSTTMIRL